MLLESHICDSQVVTCHHVFLKSIIKLILKFEVIAIILYDISKSYHVLTFTFYKSSNLSFLFLITGYLILKMIPWDFWYNLVTVELVRFSYHLIYLRRHLQSNFKPMLHTTHLHKWCHVLPFIHTKEKRVSKKCFCVLLFDK